MATNSILLVLEGIIRTLVGIVQQRRGPFVLLENRISNGFKGGLRQPLGRGKQ